MRGQRPKSPGHSIESGSNFQKSIPNYSKDPVELAKREKEQLELLKKSGSSKKNKIYTHSSEIQDENLSKAFQNSRIAQEIDQQPTTYDKGFLPEQNDETKKSKAKTYKKKFTDKADVAQPIVRTDTQKERQSPNPIRIQENQSYAQSNEMKKSKNQQLEEKSYYENKDILLNT